MRVPLGADVLKAGFWKDSTFSPGDEERIGYQSDAGPVLWMLNTVRESMVLGPTLIAVAKAVKKTVLSNVRAHMGPSASSSNGVKCSVCRTRAKSQSGELRSERGAL